ncbi:uncharacterized protein LOC109901707 [Oncorhynchus kisutch]|uniref:uncharacterized protein LOC109901707 n=1 Tax=Oncorhynchus kisutch TaxID=8019 RepID=UPI0012DDA4C9|nr:uncharacterized protein LOC109901707 [Oncorhynchus kisutch]
MELLFLPGQACPLKDLSITIDNSCRPPSAKNLGVTLDNTLSFSANIKSVTRSCRFMLYNIRVQPYLTQEEAHVLIQTLVLSRLDYCNLLLAGLPDYALKPLKLIKNSAACLVSNLLSSHVTPLFRTLHWLPVEARIHYNTMALTYRTDGTALPYLQTMLKPFTPTRALRYATFGLLALQGQFPLSPVHALLCPDTPMVEPASP